MSRVTMDPHAYALLLDKLTKAEAGVKCLERLKKEFEAAKERWAMAVTAAEHRRCANWTRIDNERKHHRETVRMLADKWWELYGPPPDAFWSIIFDREPWLPKEKP